MPELMHQDDMGRLGTLRFSIREAWRSTKEIVGTVAGTAAIGGVAVGGFLGLEAGTDLIEPDSSGVEAPSAYEPDQRELLDDAWMPLVDLLASSEQAENVTLAVPSQENGAIQWGFSDTLPDGGNVTVTIRNIPYGEGAGEFTDLTIKAYNNTAGTREAQQELTELVAGAELIEIYEHRPSGRIIHSEMSRHESDGGIIATNDTSEGSLVKSSMDEPLVDETGALIADPSSVATGAVTAQVERVLTGTVAE